MSAFSSAAWCENETSQAGGAVGFFTALGCAAGGEPIRRPVHPGGSLAGKLSRDASSTSSLGSRDRSGTSLGSSNARICRPPMNTAASSNSCNRPSQTGDARDAMERMTALLLMVGTDSTGGRGARMTFRVSADSRACHVPLACGCRLTRDESTRVSRTGLGMPSERHAPMSFPTAAVAWPIASSCATAGGVRWRPSA